MSKGITCLYVNVLDCGYCRLENETPSIIRIVSTTKGFASDGEIHRVDLVTNQCLDSNQCMIEVEG